MTLPRLLPGRYVDDTLVVVGLLVMVLLQLIVAARTWTLTYFAARARDPIPMKPQPGLRVAVLTTIVPGKEPLELVMTTLRAMKRIRHDREIDVWLLDEGNDLEVRERCEEVGVRDFSRKDHPEWNQPTVCAEPSPSTGTTTPGVSGTSFEGFCGGDDAVTPLKQLAVPASLIEIEDPPGLLSEVRVSREIHERQRHGRTASSLSQRTIVDCDASQMPRSIMRR